MICPKLRFQPGVRNIVYECKKETYTRSILYLLGDTVYFGSPMHIRLIEYSVFIDGETMGSILKLLMD